MKRIFTYSLLALALGYASPAFADDNVDGFGILILRG